MNAETLEILKAMGFDYTPKLSLPDNDKLNMELTVIRNGTGTVVFCNGGMAEFETLANHGARSVKTEVKTVCAGEVPYLTLSSEKLERVFNSIARMRLLFSSDKATRRNHQSLAAKMAKDWIASLPAEQNPLYVSEYAGATVASFATSDFYAGKSAEASEQDELPNTPLFAQIESGNAEPKLFGERL